jgi:hypothetical protein
MGSPQLFCCCHKLHQLMALFHSSVSFCPMALGLKLHHVLPSSLWLKQIYLVPSSPTALCLDLCFILLSAPALTFPIPFSRFPSFSIVFLWTLNCSCPHLVLPHDQGHSELVASSWLRQVYWSYWLRWLRLGELPLYMS